VIKKTDIPNDTITYAKMQNAVADNVVLGNILGAGEAFQELTSAQVAGIVDGELLIDEDDMASDTDAKAPTQQSTKAYVDGAVAANAPDVVLLDTQTASNSASIDFTGLSATYTRYEIQYTNVVPATDGARIGLRTSTDGGSTFDSGASDYNSQNHGHVSTTDSSSAYTGTYIRLALAGTGNGANEMCSGVVQIIHPSASAYTHTLHQAVYWSTLGALNASYGSAYRASTTAVDAAQILFDTGNITSGTFKLYGYK
jgi:hypothetical protein